MKTTTFMLTFLSIFSFCSCGKNALKADEMNYFSYSIQGSMAFGEKFSVTRTENGALVEIQFYEKTVSEVVDATIFADLQAIINKNRVYKFKKSYFPKLEILDGEMWNLQVDYSDSAKNIYSRGENCYPQRGGEAFAEFRNYFLERFLKE